MERKRQMKIHPGYYTEKYKERLESTGKQDKAVIKENREEVNKSEGVRKEFETKTELFKRRPGDGKLVKVETLIKHVVPVREEGRDRKTPCQARLDQRQSGRCLPRAPVRVDSSKVPVVGEKKFDASTFKIPKKVKPSIVETWSKECQTASSRCVDILSQPKNAPPAAYSPAVVCTDICESGILTSEYERVCKENERLQSRVKQLEKEAEGRKKEQKRSRKGAEKDQHDPQ